MMAGLIMRPPSAHGRDWCINLEVTSNRPDCLGHLGIARESGRAVRPRADVAGRRAARGRDAGAEDFAKVRIDCPSSAGATRPG